MQKLNTYHFEKKREVKDFIYLKNNYLKQLLYYFMCLISIFIVYAIVNSMQNLKAYIYDKVDKIDDADYVFLFLETGDIDILKINHVKAKIFPKSQSCEFMMVEYANKKFYYSKKNRVFKILGNRFANKVYKNPHLIPNLLDPLDENEYCELKKFYGANFIMVIKKTFFEYLYEFIKQPINLLNFVASIYFLLYERQYAHFIRIHFNLTILFVMKRWEYLKEIENVNAICNDNGKSVVYRKNNNKVSRITIESSELTVGDIVEIDSTQQINFDCLLFNGTCVVDQSTLTGESIPIIKRGIVRGDPIKSYNKIFAGSTCLQKKSKRVFGIVTAIGFDSFQGNLISTMSTKNYKPFKFYEDLMKLFFTFLIICLIFFAFVLVQDILHDNFNFDKSVLIFVQICLYSFPIGLFVSLFLSERVVSYKLAKAGIKKASSDYILKAGRMKLVCFDKTGTLTENGMKFKGFILPKEDSFGEFSNNVEECTPLKQQRIIELMACCNSINFIDGKTLGDPIELEINKFTGFTFDHFTEENKTDSNTFVDDLNYFQREQEIEESHSLAIVPNDEFTKKYSINKDHYYTIKRYMHFDSTRRRMSVVVNNPIDTQKYLVFMKGAPEVVADQCIQASIPQNYKYIVDNLTKGGLRVLAMSYKEVDNFDGQEEEIESNLTFMGLLIFINPLKDGVNKVINDLRMNDIKSIMITGDALNTAVHVGYEAGIVNEHKLIWIGALNSSKKYIKWYQINETNILKNKYMESKYSEDETVMNKTVRDSQLSHQYDILKIDITNKLHDCMSHECVLALDGDTIEYLIEKYLDNEPEFLALVFKYTLIFGRTNPYQKKLIVKFHKQLKDKQNYTVGFVGDGTNDSEALYEADIGLSLANKLSSLVSSYYTLDDKIEKIKTISIEGKYALISSIEILSFSIYVSMANNVTLLFMGLFGLEYTSYEFIANLFHFFPFYILLALTKSSNKLTYHYPPPSFFNKSVFVPLILSNVLMIILTFNIYLILMNDITFKDIGYILYNTKNIINDDNNFFQSKILALYWFYRSIFQAWAVAIGIPFKKTILTNKLFISYSIFLIIYNSLNLFEEFIGIHWYKIYLVQFVRLPNIYLKTSLKYFALFFVSGFFTVGINRVAVSYYLIQDMNTKQKLIQKKDKMHRIDQSLNDLKTQLK